MKYKMKSKKNLLSILLLLVSMVAYSNSQEPVMQATSSAFDKNYLLLSIAIILLLPIYLLAKVFLYAIKMLIEKEKESAALKTILILAFCFIGNALMAQDATEKPVSPSTPIFTITNVLVGVIVLETFIIIFFGGYVLSFLKKIRPQAAVVSTKKPLSFNKWWKKTNNFIPIEEEDHLDTGHNYDGIRELDNVIPPWFTAAFFISIVIAVSYLWRYHVSQSAPLQIEEYQIEMADAEKEKQEFLKNAANSVDENTVTLLDAAGIEEGKTLFVANCSACHAATGASMPGGVGPNLTDEYWLHGGGLKDVFKTIKYGWPEKGMRSWKDQFSPKQIAQLTSYVKSISNTNVKGKEPQGEIYKEETIVKDTTATKVDSATLKK